MPIYEYHCRGCDNEFERLIRSRREESNVTCPSCDSKDVEKRVSVFAARGAEASSAPRPPGCGGCADPSGSCPYQP